MNAKRILFATDFSETAGAALEYASSLARDAGATLYIVHVGHFRVANTDWSSFGLGTSGYVPELDNLEEVRNRLSATTPTVSGVCCEHRYLEGDPADEIVDFARRQNIDLVVMGTHGRTGLNHVLLGSVAEAVVRRANCPVLTVKQTAAHSPTASESPHGVHASIG